MTADKAAVWPWRYTPRQVFFAFALLHLAAWTIVPTLFSPNAPLDVIEGYAWGREWLLGTYKHPPMQSWWLEVLAMVTGRAGFAHFLASQIAIVLTFWAVWQTGRRVTDENRALLGVLLLEGIAYYNFTTPEFNPNVLQLPFWALMAWSFHRGVTKNKISDWLLLGVWAAGGMYSKYTAVILIGMLGLVLVAHPAGRARLKGIGPWAAAAAFTALFAPHIYWLITHGWQPFTYTESRMDHADGLAPRAGQTLQFLIHQFGVIVAAVLLLFTLSWEKSDRPETRIPSFDKAFIWAVAWGPLLFVVLLSLIAGIKLRDMWGSSLWNFAGLGAIMALQLEIPAIRWHRFAAGWGFAFLLALVLHTAFDVAGPYVDHRDKRVAFPGQEMAAQMNAAWQDGYHRPLEYAIGDTWLAGNLAYYAPGAAEVRPHVLLGGDYGISQWIDPADLRRKGGIITWCSNHCRDAAVAAAMPEELARTFPHAAVQKPLTLRWQTGAALPPVVIGWALLPPQSGDAP